MQRATQNDCSGFANKHDLSIENRRFPLPLFQLRRKKNCFFFLQYCSCFAPHDLNTIHIQRCSNFRLFEICTFLSIPRANVYAFLVGSYTFYDRQTNKYKIQTKTTTTKTNQQPIKITISRVTFFVLSHKLTHLQQSIFVVNCN